MDTGKNYLSLEKLEVYILSRRVSKIAWDAYEKMDWRIKKIIGDQYIESTDSVGANTAEGYGRFHYLEKVKFYYNARGSLLESRHWNSLLYERKLITALSKDSYLLIYKDLRLGLNGLIKSVMIQKNS